MEAAIQRGVFESRYLSVAGLTLLLWDHCLTFERERQLIWPSRAFVKWAFLAMRYIVPVAQSIEAYTMSGIAPSGLSIQFCRFWLVISFLLGQTTLSVSHFLVLLWLWKLWDGRKAVILSTIVAYAMTQIGMVILFSFVVHEALPSVTLDLDLGMCIGTQTPMAMKGVWALSCTFELFLFLMVCWNALNRPRAHNLLLGKVLYRDGICFFVILSALGWMNFVLATAAPVYQSLLGIFCNWALSITVVSRLVMNLREAELLSARV